MVYTDGIHLVADTEEELHQFANQMGLRREWFQDQGKYPHYDLTTRRATLRAVSTGAEQISTRELIRIMR